MIFSGPSVAQKSTDTLVSPHLEKIIPKFVMVGGLLVTTSTRAKNYPPIIQYVINSFEGIKTVDLITFG